MPNKITNKIRFNAGENMVYIITIEGTMGYSRFKRMSDAEREINKTSPDTPRSRFDTASGQMDILVGVFCEFVVNVTLPDGTVVPINNEDDIPDIRLINPVIDYLVTPLK